MDIFLEENALEVIEPNQPDPEEPWAVWRDLLRQIPFENRFKCSPSLSSTASIFMFIFGLFIFGQNLLWKLEGKAALLAMRRFWVQVQAFLCVLAPVHSHNPKTHTLGQLKTPSCPYGVWVCVPWRTGTVFSPLSEGLLEFEPGWGIRNDNRVDPCWSCEIQKDALLSERDVSVENTQTEALPVISKWFVFSSLFQPTIFLSLTNESAAYSSRLVSPSDICGCLITLIRVTDN